MPFQSEAQRRLFYAKMNRGEISPETAKKWQAETKKQGKKLPERVEKTAFMKGFGDKAGKFVKDWREPLMGAAAFGGLTGLLGYAGDLEDNDEFKREYRRELRRKSVSPQSAKGREIKKELSRKYRRRAAAYQGTLGAISGAALGMRLKAIRKAFEGAGQRAYQQGYRGRGNYGGNVYYRARDIKPYQKLIGLTGSEKTKAEAKRVYMQAVRKNHPDIGGSHEVAAKINDAWDKIRESDWFQKLAFPYFLRGFEKQARTLTAKGRNQIDTSNFVYPEERKFPIHDIAHARNALARAHFAPDPERVRKAVYTKYPSLRK